MAIPEHAGFIHGELVRGDGAEIVVEDPSTGAVFARLPGLSAAQVESVIHSARSAYAAGLWSDLAAKERAQILGSFVNALAARKDALADIIVSEAGCPRHRTSIRSGGVRYRLSRSGSRRRDGQRFALRSVGLRAWQRS